MNLTFPYLDTLRDKNETLPFIPFFSLSVIHYISGFCKKKKDLLFNQPTNRVKRRTHVVAGAVIA